MQSALQATSARPVGRLGNAAGRRLRVIAAGLSPEQQAFLDRQARERTSSPTPAPTRGRGSSQRPASVRPSSRVPAQAPPAYSSAPAPSSYSAPAAAPSGSLSAEQQEFLRRRQQESRSPAPSAAPTRGRGSSQRPASVRPSSRTPVQQPASYTPSAPAYSSAPAPSYSAPAAAPSGSLSAEQQEFLRRRSQEPRSTSPAPTRGRTASPRPSSRPPAVPPASYSAPAQSYSAPAAAPAGGMSGEQQEFLRRRAQEVRSASPAANPTRGRSGSQRPASVRPSSRAPVQQPASSSSYSAPPPSYSAPPSASAPAPAAAAPSGSLSAEQQEFLRRRQQESRSPAPSAAPTRGRSGSQRPASVRPSSRAPVQPPPSPPAQAAGSQPRTGDVEFARAALERNITQVAPAVHPRDQEAPPVQAYSPPAQAYLPPPAPRAPAPQPTGPNTGRWPDPAFFHATAAAFPAKAVCDPEEARCLIDAGYTVMDVRPELETNARGKLRGSVPIPCVFQRQQFDSTRNEMVTSEQDNPAFLTQVLRKFPRKDARIIVACGNGKQFSIDVLEALEDEGYTNIVGMMGGLNTFFKVFDFKLNPRDKRPVKRRQMKNLL